MLRKRTDNASSEQDTPGGRGGRANSPRRLIAGLRVSYEDEQLLGLVTPFFPEASSAGELAYRIWRRGLELSLAELAGLGTTLPATLSEEHLATLVAQRLMLCLPLLQRTGKLAFLKLGEAAPVVSLAPPVHVASDAIDQTAVEAVAGFGGDVFL